ncbi:hypothetical protein BOTBODRAFT_287381 [Botryobasidium botryosum FD-172 SS1]|uniref:Signal recognition particle subunit SRP14 n=1 Tax=Botryobasidium botryosum (strain FD-172 SS1) TaxID=930990 RepID=A0A067MM11_BOTB1|nr:hypothetical protein BOTBODRAFT_287381 [Botryobasidium botryosum FD-172 SS1]
MAKGKPHMELVDHEAFLSKLTTLFESAKDKGSVWMTHKRLTYEDEGDTDVDAKASDKEYSCLVRVTDGKSTNFSTRVKPGELEKFHGAYGALVKASMTTMRKRDKKKEKQRAEQAALRKKKLEETVPMAGSKRGNGHRKRQRRIKAVAKQEEARNRVKSEGVDIKVTPA